MTSGGTPTRASSERLMPLREVARRCSVSPRTVRRWIASGRLAAIRTGTSAGPLRVSDRALQRFLEAAAVRPPRSTVHDLSASNSAGAANGSGSQDRPDKVDREARPVESSMDKDART